MPMPTPMTAASRRGRAVTGAALSTLVALSSHVLAGGAMPSIPGLLVPLLLSIAVCFQFAGKELSLWRLSVAVIVSQWLFHQLFVLGAGGVGLTTSGGIHAGHDVGSIAVHDVAHTHGGGGMTFSYALAAVVTIAAIFRAEQLFVALAHGAQRMHSAAHCAVFSRLQAPAPMRMLAPRTSPIAGPSCVGILLDVASSPLSRRGPPVLVG